MSVSVISVCNIKKQVSGCSMMFDACSSTVLCDFSEDDLRVAKGGYYLLTGLSVSGYDWVLNEEIGKFRVLVDLLDELCLSHATALLHQEVHDCLWYQVCDSLLDDCEIAVDKVLDDASLHDYARAFLFRVSPQLLLDIIQNDLRQVTVLINHWSCLRDLDLLPLPGGV